MLEYYFLLGPMPGNAETGTYDLWLVLLSYAVASLGAETSITLAAHMTDAKTRRARNLLHVGGAFALGSGIWSMHFIGMLAFRMNMEVRYDAQLTFLSMLIAIGIAWTALAITRSTHWMALKIGGGAILLGGAISAMHYTGMAAMNMDADLRFTPGLYTLSVIIAITASAAALGILFILGRHKGRFQHLWRILAALVMGAAICGMHYTGMAAAVFMPMAEHQYDPEQDFNSLALAIALVTSVIFGISFATTLYVQEGLPTHGQENVPAPGIVRKFPTRLLLVASGLTLIALLWTGGSDLYVDSVLKNKVRQNLILNKLADRIDYLNDAIDRATHKMVSTGNPAWQEAHERDAGLLDQTIGEAKARSLTPVLRDEITGMDKTSDLLKDLEKQSFQLVRDGKKDQAIAVIEGEEYLSIRESYSKDRMKFTTDLDDLLFDVITGFIQKVSYGIYFSLLLITLLPITWFFSFRSIRHWRMEMETTQNSLAARELELQLLIGEIEMSQTAAIKARAAAERANAAKSDFLANMSHEIRTPMNGLLGMARLLLGSELTPEQRSWAEIVANSGENLMSIINDILDISKLEAGRLTLEAQPFNLHATIADVMDMLILKAQEKNIELLVQFTPDMPQFLMGDAVRIKQIILNLASNAVKFTSKGHVLIDVQGTQEAGDIQLRVRVEDTGIGIPGEKLEYIFDKFSQAEESTARRFGGTGLGLTISRRLVAMMGGKIEVDSIAGQGSIFSFDIRLPIAAQAPVSSVPACRLKGLRALVLCDSEPERKIIARYLNAWQMGSDFCSALHEPLQKLLEAKAENRPFHFLYIDYRASVQKIMELVSKIRALPELRDVMIIISAIFGSATASQVLKSEDVSALLTKPLFPDQLQDAFKILWDAQKNNRRIGLVTRSMIAWLQNGEARAREQNLSFHGLHVLVVEDMHVNQLLMAKILERLGCQIDTATSGLKAINKMRSSDYDLVFMDCQMPEMDGFEATKHIRQAETANGKHTTIVALTADAMTGDREKCLNAGMDDYLNKPFKPEQITDMLRKWTAPA